MTDTPESTVSDAARKREFIRWTDLLVIVAAALVWSAPTVAIVLAHLAHVGETVIAGIIRFNLGTFWGLQVTLASFYLILLLFIRHITRRVSATAFVARYTPIPASYFLPAIGIGIALGIVGTLCEDYLARHGVQIPVTSTEQLSMPQSLGQLPVGLFTIAFLAPFAEEYYFRGIVLSWLVRKMPVVLAIVCNGAIFGLFHMRFMPQNGIAGLYATGYIALAGMIGATLAIRARSLWASCAMHGAYNATLISIPVLFALGGK
jgi:membrane protease YdiL (CAAX protease family)